MTKLQLNFYNIKTCGIYTRKGHELKMLGPSKLFAELKKWAIDSKKPLIETSTYSANKNFLEAFCLDVAESNGQFLISLWNKLPSSKYGVGVVNGSKNSGAVEVSNRRISQKDIPGYPSYFWVCPKHHVIIALRFDIPTLGISQFTEYMKGFLTHYTPHTVRRTEGKDVIQGLSEFPKPVKGADSRVPNTSLYPRFMISPRHAPTKHEEITERADSIRKLVKDVSVYNSLVDDDASVVEKIRTFFNDLPPSKERTMRVQMPVTINSNEVKGLIRKYEESDFSEAYNVGFVFKGDSNHIVWLDGANKKEDFQYEPLWKVKNQQPDLFHLLNNLQSKIDLDAHIKVDEEKPKSDAKRPA